MPLQTTISADQRLASAFSFERQAAAKSGYKPLIFIILIALSLRTYWMAAKTPVINGEGAEYVRMAQNLADGKGLVGNFEGPETMYAPLFSVLTAALHFVVKDAELAGHLISLAFGIALTLPVFFIARRMYGERVAYLSAVLVAFHPLLIALSGSIYNENVYLPLLLAGVYFGMRALESHRNADYVLLSLCFSLAYLSRPEAFAYPLFFTFALWVSVVVARLPVRRAALGSALILGTFVLVASPYIRFLYVHTGHVQLQGKWDANYTTANRLRSGMSYNEATMGLGLDSSIAGSMLDPFHFVSYTPYPQSLAAKVETLWAMAERNREVVSHLLRDSAVGGPLALALVLIGLFRKSWNRRRLFHESILVCMATSVLVLMLTASDASFRYILPLVALSIVWIAKGIDELGQWTRGLACSMKIRFLPAAQSMGLAVEVVLLLLICVVSFLGTRTNWFFLTEQASYADLKEAGVWLKNFSPGPKRIAAGASVLTYYAEGTLVALPYAEPSRVLRYLDSENVDFVIVDSQYSTGFPEVVEWLKYGIPNDRAKLIYEAGSDAKDKTTIYRWEKHRGGH